MTVTVSMHFVHELFKGLPDREIPPTRYLERAGISPFLLSAPHGRVTVEQFAELYRGLVNELDDETPGFFSRPLRGGTLKLLCLSMLDAPNLQVALHRYTQFFVFCSMILAMCLAWKETLPAWRWWSMRHWWAAARWFMN